MTQVEDAFRAHPLWAQVAVLEQILDAGQKVEAPEALEHLARLRGLIAALKAQHDQDPNFVPVQTMNNLSSAVQALNQVLQNWQSQPSNWQGYLVPAATTQADQIVTYLAALPPLPTAALAATDAAAQEVAARAQQMILGLQSEVQTLEQRILAQQQAADAAVAEQRQLSQAAIDAAVTRQQALETQVATLATTVTEQSTRLDRALTDQNEKFLSSQAEREKAAEEARTSEAARAQRSLAVISDTAQERERARAADAEAHMARLAELHQIAEDVVGATGRRAITSDYGKFAQAERWNAFGWSIAAVLLALLGFAFIAYEIHEIGDTKPTWQLTVFKLTGSLALLGVAGYAGRQASIHRERETDAKRTQLDINAIEPFLERLPEEKQDELRAEIADRVFARHTTGAANDDATNDALPVTVNGLAAAVAEALKVFQKQ